MNRLLALAILLAAGPALAGSYTITTNAKQDAVLTRVAADAGVTVQAYINSAVAAKVQADYGSLVGQTIGTQVGNQWSTLTGAQQGNICTALGIASCPP